MHYFPFARQFLWIHVFYKTSAFECFLFLGRLWWASVVFSRWQPILSVRHRQLGTRMCSARISWCVHCGILLLGLDKGNDRLWQQITCTFSSSSNLIIVTRSQYFYFVRYIACQTYLCLYRENICQYSFLKWTYNLTVTNYT